MSFRKCPLNEGQEQGKIKSRYSQRFVAEACTIKMVYSEAQNIKQLQHLNWFSQLPQNGKDTEYPDTIMGVP